MDAVVTHMLQAPEHRPHSLIVWPVCVSATSLWAGGWVRTAGFIYQAPLILVLLGCGCSGAS